MVPRARQRVPPSSGSSYEHAFVHNRCATLVNAYPFLFSFGTRRLFLHSTAFGLSRALQRLHAHAHEASSSSASSGAESRLESRLGRLPRQKVRISRSRLLDSAVRVMELYAAQPALLEVEYFGEVGTGLGPTLEFYALVSHDLRKAELDLWYHEEQPISDEPPAAAPDSTEAPLGGAAAERARDKHEKLVRTRFSWPSTAHPGNHAASHFCHLDRCMRRAVCFRGRWRRRRTEAACPSGRFSSSPSLGGYAPRPCWTAGSSTSVSRRPFTAICSAASSGRHLLGLSPP